MNNNNEERNNRTTENEHTLNLDEILTTQPELGPSIPDGGCGWIVFVGTLFFQALIPCLIVNLGVLLAFSKLEHGTAEDKNIILWADKILYVPLFFAISRSLFDAGTRTLVAASTPRLTAVVGTCFTCAGLLFVWMGMTGEDDDWLFVPAGILTGLGACILTVQCDLILAQYFRLKLPVLHHISQFVVTLGFLIAPVALGHYILSTGISHVLLWYQAIILQGLVVGLLFRKPLYLKSRGPKPYNFASSSPDDEEDIFSKNSRELQIKRQTSRESYVSKIQIDQPQPSTSSNDNKQKEWETFEEQEDEDHGSDIKYAKLDDWEVFDEDEDAMPKNQNWECFEDDESSSPRIRNELSLAEETRNEERATRPTPLFADFPVNNNNTYAYDDEVVPETTNTNVFMPNPISTENFKKHLDYFKEPTFYKSLLMAIANTYSSFLFYTLFPSYLYIEADSIDIRHMTGLVGALALVNLVFLSISYWINIDSKKRPICFWVFYWIGSVGYFMIADFKNEYLLLVGGVQVVLSIGVLEYTSKPVLGVSMRGETNKEHTLLSVLSSLALFLFLFMNATFKTCFRLIAVVHFFAGTLWLANYAYKKLRAW